MHTELWFPSVVWSSICHVVDNSDIKEYAYDRKRNDVGNIISNYGGWQSTDIRTGDHHEIDALVEHLDHEMNWCAQQVGLLPLQIQNLWININPPGSYNEQHDHQGSILSGVYYVDADEGQGNLVFDRTDSANFFVLPKDTDKMTYFTSPRAMYKGKTNALYIFPSWMRHSVQGNTTHRDRISISFNYGAVE